jgi:beta-glucanase (GH16 family)
MIVSAPRDDENSERGQIVSAGLERFERIRRREARHADCINELFVWYRREVGMVVFNPVKRVVPNLTVTLLLLILTNAFGGGWRQTWSDEFDGVALNEQNWRVITANPGWVNNEQQRYSAGHDNAGANIFVKNGNLIIEARKTTEITSGRIEGQNLKSFKYGRMEARMRLPITKGMWPAFWMLGADGGGWPACGEIDIMEGKGSVPNYSTGAFHSSLGTPTDHAYYSMPAGNAHAKPLRNVHDDFHTYAVQWNTDSIQWFVDTNNFFTIRKSQHPGLPIDKQYYFILNLAVGGTRDGSVDNTTVWPESLLVDYVRVSVWDPSVGTVPASIRPTASPVTITNAGRSFDVDLATAQKYSLELFAINGRRVLSRNGLARSVRLETADLAPGTYFVTLSGLFGVHTQRVFLCR